MKHSERGKSIIIAFKIVSFKKNPNIIVSFKKNPNIMTLCKI